MSSANHYWSGPECWHNIHHWLMCIILVYSKKIVAMTSLVDRTHIDGQTHVGLLQSQIAHISFTVMKRLENTPSIFSIVLGAATSIWRPKRSMSFILVRPNEINSNKTFTWLPHEIFFFVCAKTHAIVSFSQKNVRIWNLLVFK